MEIKCNVKDSDFSGLVQAINRLHNDFGMDQAQAVRRGTILLVKSLRARTPKARPVRRVRPLHGRRSVTIGGVKKRFFVVDVYRGGSPTPQPVTILAASAAEAKRSPKARIEKFGLAKKSWGWFMNKLFGQSAGADPNPAAVITPNMVFATRVEKADEAHTILENRLEYIGQVVPHAVVADSVTAATNRMNHLIEQRVARAAQRGLK